MKELSRFHEAQALAYERALKEIRQGKKTSEWIWYIFPQLEGLGNSTNANFYGIHNLDEARAYLNDEVLGKRLNELSQMLLSLKLNDATEIFGTLDALKLRSCMTLFSIADPSNSVFKSVLSHFFNDNMDSLTIALLQNQEKD